MLLVDSVKENLKLIIQAAEENKDVKFVNPRTLEVIHMMNNDPEYIVSIFSAATILCALDKNLFITFNQMIVVSRVTLVAALRGEDKE